MIKKLLIANRGEIAVRIIKTAQKLGVSCVAVYSDADENSPHVELADEAVHIGASSASESYLKIENLIAAAKKTGSDAIHPGYGFLSENADFAAACEDAGIIFVGPSAAVIRLMGSKREAKALMADNGVPVVPGYFGDADADQLSSEAAKIGFPVLIKASAGGGGRGMRLVHEAAEFSAALISAQREALSAFGDDTVLLEKYIDRPRHIEVQIFGDSHGNVVHLYERDCSVQRRYQKLIEEAPASLISNEQRELVQKAAVTAGTAAGYQGAGTVEFVVDSAGGVYFIEMNTRLQVEHPVTEMITGNDLVAWQLRIANGDHLPAQETIVPSGHAFELRLCAEDANNDFAPSTGTITHLQFPGNEVRTDHGIRAGLSVSPFYDSMIAKLIVHGEDRASALQQAVRALECTQVSGVTTNRAFLKQILQHPDFINGELDTHFIERQQSVLLEDTATQAQLAAVVAALYLIASRHVGDEPSSPWTNNDAFRLNTNLQESLVFNDQQTNYTLDVEHQREQLLVRSGDDAFTCVLKQCGLGTIVVVIDGAKISASVVRTLDTFNVFMGGEQYEFTYTDPLADTHSGDAATGGLAAPMPGTVLDVFVQVGELVEAGQPIMLIEAMKIEHTITAPFDGTVSEVRFKAGDQIDAEGVALAVMEPS